MYVLAGGWSKLNNTNNASFLNLDFLFVILGIFGKLCLRFFFFVFFFILFSVLESDVL